jgi:membrane-associated phospholipid phosphatase
MMRRTSSLVICGCLAATLSARPALAQGQAQAPQPATGGVMFLELADDTLRDFTRLPSRETLTWLAIGGAIALSGSSLDHAASNELSSMSALASPFEPGKTIGGARLQIVGAAATYAIGKFTGHPRVAAIGGDLLRAQFVTQTVTAAIKLSVRRGRPDGTEFSFPSGHSSVTFATATVLQRHLGWKVGVPAYAVASYVAASRIQEKRHFLSDVVFGAAIGMAAGRTVTIGRGDAQFAVAPTAAAGGAGVSFTWLPQR